MFRFAIAFFTIALLLITSEFAQAGSISPSECPKDKAYIAVEVGGNENLWRHQKLLASVVVKAVTGSDKEDYLHRRADGWTYLSSEANRVIPGNVITNCLPIKAYLVKVEYYKQIPLIGDWLGAIRRHTVYLTQLNVISDDSPETRWSYPTWQDHLVTHWQLFLLYGLIMVVFPIWLVFIIQRLKK